MMTSWFRSILAYCFTLALVAGCGGRGQEVGHYPGPSKPPPPVPPLRKQPLDPELRAAAEAQIDAALKDDTGRIRANALEVLRETAGQQRQAEILAALKDPEAGVRGAAALAAGELRIEEAMKPLLAMVQDPDPTVRVAVRYALHRLGNTRFSHDLEKTARHPDPAVRGATAMVLGMLNEPTALKILKVLRRDPDPSVRQQALEAMWRLGDEAGRNELVGFTASRYVDDQMFAILALAAPRDQTLRDQLRSMLTADYLEVSLTAARGLGMLDSDAGYGVALEGARSSDPLQRFLAARAFGAIGRSDAQGPLRKLLEDENERVRLAAAAAILQLKR